MCASRAAAATRYEADHEAMLPDIEEMAVAAELLGSADEAALDKVLAVTIADAARQSGGALPTTTGRALREIVKRVLRRVLPTVGRAPGLLSGRGGHVLPLARRPHPGHRARRPEPRGHGTGGGAARRPLRPLGGAKSLTSPAPSTAALRCKTRRLGRRAPLGAGVPSAGGFATTRPGP